MKKKLLLLLLMASAASAQKFPTTRTFGSLPAAMLHSIASDSLTNAQSENMLLRTENQRSPAPMLPANYNWTRSINRILSNKSMAADLYRIDSNGREIRPDMIDDVRVRVLYDIPPSKF